MLTATDLAADILARRTERYERERKATRQDHPRASSIGRCAREIYHSIVDREHKPFADQWLEERWQRGRDIQSIVARQLMADGYTLVHGEVPFEIKERIPHVRVHGVEYIDINENGQVCDPDPIIICTGHIDGRIEWNGLKPVVEIKSLNPNTWSRVNDVRDFTRMGSFWTYYPRQLLLYMYANNEDHGLFILDDCLGHLKMLPMVLSEWLDECEQALQTARTAAVAALTNEPPPQIEDMSVCRECWAHSIGLCMPAMAAPTEGLQVLDDPDLVEGLDRMEQLHEAADEYRAIEKNVKGRFKGTEGERLAGDWLVRTKLTKRTTYNPPKDQRDPAWIATTEAWSTTWERVGK